MKFTIQHTIQAQSKVTGQKPALKPLAFSLGLSISEDHNIIGLFGPSGAGKSTVFKILAGLIPTADYSMQWQSYHNSNKRGHQNPCVYVGEDTQLFAHINVLNNLKLVEKQSDTRTQSPFSVDEVISLCELSELTTKMPWQLSTGEKQRSCFARALLTGKKILLLDEAFSALDWPKRMAFNRLLREIVEQHGYYVFMVSHSLRELSVCVTKLITIDSGKITEQATLTDALSNKLANNEADHEHYFSAISATFSHIEQQDATLQVWTLLKSDLHVNGNKDQGTLYVKDQLANAVHTLIAKQNDSTAKLPETQTFVVDANKVSISISANHQTSMLNSLLVTVQTITHINSGVLICAKWQSQILRSIITKKSFTQLNIKTGDTLYFVFKAL